ncbi:MAG: Hsp20/alpha crystallin family protein [Burkholderiales bacterium]|nr:Hsp20/alpha crystallin family protein [Burkholderiales bacterium]
MLETLQQFGREIGRDLARGWESLTEGWRELLSRSANALTRFTRKDKDGGDVVAADAPHWSLLAGDVMDTGGDIVVRLELPGVEKDDCEVVVEGNVLYVRGEKRMDHTAVAGGWYLRQCAFGAFERAIALPCAVHAERAEASFRNGVLTVRLPKAEAPRARRIRIG